MCRQYFSPVLKYRHRMLKVRRWLPVGRAYGPSIALLDHVPGAHVDHRLNGKHHARLDLWPPPPLAVIRHFRVFMQVFAYPMAYQFPYHAIPELLHVSLDGKTDIPDPVSHFGLANA